MRRFRKPVWRQRQREFESHPLRCDTKPGLAGLCVFLGGVADLDDQGAQVRVRIFGVCVRRITLWRKVLRLGDRHWSFVPGHWSERDEGAQVSARSWARYVTQITASGKVLKIGARFCERWLAGRADRGIHLPKIRSWREKNAPSIYMGWFGRGLGWGDEYWQGFMRNPQSGHFVVDNFCG